MLLNYVCNNFRLHGKLIDYEKIESGNINTTYLVTTENNGIKSKYVVQKINKYVFKNPRLLMKNVTLVTNHIKNKFLNKENIACLDYVKTKKGSYYFIDDSKEFWRVSKFIENSICYLTTEDLCVIKEAGRAYGQFQKLVSDFDISLLHETIKDFHNTEKRFSDLKKSADYDLLKRKQEVLEQLGYLFSKRNLAEYYCQFIKNGQLKLKVTHNDTKCSNVLFDKNTGKALTVIDLDTVMAGLIAYDFGDATRSICSNFGEDEEDTGKIDFDLDRFEAFTSGFLNEVGDTLSDLEKQTLYMAPLVAALELSVRFLKDYLDGDLYFKCDYKKQNLIRANNQIALSKKILLKLSDVKKIIEKYL